MSNKNGVSMWTCPLCWTKCPYGEMGCEDPLSCTNEKNINYQIFEKRSRQEGVQNDSDGIGISEIANDAF